MSDVTSTSATTDPIKLSDIKRHLNVSTTDDDVLLGDYTVSATKMLEDRMRRCWITQTRTLKMQTFNDPRYVFDRAIQLPRSPISSASSDVTINYINSTGGSTSISTTAYRVSTDASPGCVTEEYNNTWPVTRNVADDVTITYKSGYGSTQADVPGNVKHAIRMVVAHWYRNRESVLTGSISKEIEMGVDALLGSEEYPDYG